jgi:three-Cys-motif partner protein
MSQTSAIRFDEIGNWSEVKLDIVKDYASAYSTILSKQPLSHAYVDGFSGAGFHIAKVSQRFVRGSPLNALLIDPPFKDYYFIDLDGIKIAALEQLTVGKPNVHLYKGDCNEVLLKEVFPALDYKQYRRGLCLLDPYGLDISWTVIETAGKMKTIDLFLNFPVMDMNRNALWREPEGVSKAAIARMNRFWGDESWRKIAYKTTRGLFEDINEKVSNEVVANAFRTRLKDVAGFANVPEPTPMRNSKGAVVYYLFFASQKDVANKIVKHIFKKYDQS